MNILFLIGNGFDLNCGLKTSFKDVLLSYIKEPSTNGSIQSFKDDIIYDLENWSDFENYMGTYTNRIKKEATPDKTFLEYKKCIYDFKNYLKNYLENEEKKSNYTNTSAIIECYKRSIFNFTQFLDNGPRGVIDKMMEDALQYNFINFNYTCTFDKCFDIFKSDKSALLKRKNRNAMVTYTTNNFLGAVFHIHGRLGNNNDMILGVDNVNQIENNDFLFIKNMDLYIKPRANDGLENNKNSIVKNLVHKADLYCVFGMSLGKTDKTWWVEIAKQLYYFQQKRLLIFAFDKNYAPVLSEDVIEKKDYFKKQFLDNIQFTDYNYGEEKEKDDFREKLLKRITVSMSKDIFNIKLV